MPRFDVPDDIRDLADQRSAARRARDWATADLIKAELERLGWRVIDAASLYDLERAVPPDVEDGGVIRYGAAASVPSRLDEPASGTATVVLVANDGAGAAAAADAAGRVHVESPGAQVIVVANGLWPGKTTALTAPPDGVEVVWLAERLGHAAALNAGIRRASSSVVVLLDPGVVVTGDLAGTLVAALDDATVAVAGPFGLASDDLRRFDPAPAHASDVVAVDGTAMAFRRADYVARGPLDEHFTIPASLDAWWSLVLRDQGEDDPDDAVPRRAVQAGATLAGRPVEAAAANDGGATERLAKRAFYRVLKRFGTRRDLLVGGEAR
jgi:glycosyltransferase involved in cell wall biosynthesis